MTGNLACNAGGGIHAGYGSPTLVVLDSSIDDNLGAGGVIVATGIARFERSTIDGNLSTNHIAGGIGANAPVTLINTSVSFNTAPEFGGAALDYGTLDGVVIEGNSSHGLTAGALTVTDSVIRDNGGLGVYALGSVCDLRLEDTVIEANREWGVVLRQGARVNCSGDVGIRAGFFRNVRGAVDIRDGGGTLVGDVCDFGVGSDDNNPGNWEIYTAAGRYAYGDDVTVTCAASGCL